MNINIYSIIFSLKYQFELNDGANKIALEFAWIISLENIINEFVI